MTRQEENKQAGGLPPGGLQLSVIRSSHLLLLGLLLRCVEGEEPFSLKTVRKITRVSSSLVSYVGPHSSSILLCFVIRICLGCSLGFLCFFGLLLRNVIQLVHSGSVSYTHLTLPTILRV